MINTIHMGMPIGTVLKNSFKEFSIVGETQEAMLYRVLCGDPSLYCTNSACKLMLDGYDSLGSWRSKLLGGMHFISNEKVNV